MLKIISHRGNDNHSYKENSKDAILYVLNKDYIDGVEFDVRMTKDKKIIVFHDPVIINMFDIKFIKKMNYKDIKKIYNDVFLLEDVLENINSDKKIIIEIKEETSNYINLVNLVNDIIKKFYNLNIYVCSFNYELLNYYYNLNSDIKLGLLISLNLNKDKINNKFSFNSIFFTNLDDIKFNKEIMIWGTNSRKILNRLKKINYIYSKYDIDIITDNPSNFKD